MATNDGRLYCADCGCRHDLTGCGKPGCVHCYEPQPIFLGYGGSAVEYETVCYSYRGEQIRIPMHPEIFPPEEVAVEYGVFSEAELRLAVERIDELAKEFPEDYD
jgi:hypothetical protein